MVHAGQYRIYVLLNASYRCILSDRLRRGGAGLFHKGGRRHRPHSPVTVAHNRPTAFLSNPINPEIRFCAEGGSVPQRQLSDSDPESSPTIHIAERSNATPALPANRQSFAPALPANSSLADVVAP